MLSHSRVGTSRKRKLIYSTSNPPIESVYPIVILTLGSRVIFDGNDETYMGYNFSNPYSLLLLFNTLVVVGLALFSTQFRARGATWGLVGVLVGAGIWSLADAIRLAATTSEAILFWNKITYLGIGMVAPGLVVFTVAYTGRDRWLRPRYVGVLCLLSVVMVLTVFTNPWHELWRTGETVSPGTPPPALVEELGVVHLLWNAYVLAGVIPFMVWALVTEVRDDQRSPLFRRQVAFLLGAIAVPVTTAILFTLDVTQFDLTPFGFTLLAAGMTVAVARYQLLDLVPIARDTVVEHVDSGVLVVDSNDHVVDANALAEDILEMDRSDLVGMALPTLSSELPSVPDQLAHEDETQETITVERGGEVAYYEVRISPIATERGTTVGRVALFADVTEEKRRKARLEEQKKRLERQNERLDEFAGIVAHDLRNPLQIIDANLELLDCDGEGERIEAIEDANDQMTELVDQVLTLARTGSEVVDTEDVALASVATQAWESIDTVGADLKIQTTQTVTADELRLRRCFENLFRNAVEHGATAPAVHRSDDPSEGVQTTERPPMDAADLTVTVGDRESGFYIADDGTGFPEEILDSEESVVEIYRQEGRYGLQIIDNIVEAHGWELDVSESEAGGARFEIRTT